MEDTEKAKSENSKPANQDQDPEVSTTPELDNIFTSIKSAVLEESYIKYVYSIANIYLPLFVAFDNSVCLHLKHKNVNVPIADPIITCICTG